MYTMVTHENQWRPFSNPAPLGNAGFAVSTFVSAFHTGAIGIAAGAPPNIIVGLALFYGGMAQVIAGAWSFASNKGFGAVVFTSFGCYWMSYAATLIPGFGISDALDGVSAEVRGQSLGIFNLVWTIQTLIFLIVSSRGTWGTFLLLFFLFISNLLSSIGNWVLNDGVLRASGYVGLIAAIIAWYNVALDMMAAESFYFSLPNPSIAPSAAPEITESAVHTPFYNGMCAPPTGISRLDGKTPGNPYDIIATVPQTIQGRTTSPAESNSIIASTSSNNKEMKLHFS